jgi:hypothetical protein
MRILLVDTSAYYPASPLFLEALKELGASEGLQHDFMDEGLFFGSLRKSRVHRLVFRLLGRRPWNYWAYNATLLQSARAFRPDVVIVVKGSFISPNTLRCIKRETGAVLVNYATDDPFNPVMNTRDIVASVPLYDIYACTKRAIMKDVREAGCKSPIFVPFGYKPTVHFPEPPATTEEKSRFTSEVVFIGGCDQDRIPYFETLVRSIPNIPLHLYGNYWNRHPVLRHYYRGYAWGRDYRLALNGTKIAVNLVRRSNRDGHTVRTFEIPACGAFMLAERTDEHLELFEEDKEAAYFGSVEELVEKVRYYLSHDTERERIAAAGYHKVVNGGHTNKDRLMYILSFVKG